MTEHVQDAKSIEALRRIIKEGYVDDRRRWYERNRHSPRRWFRGVGIAIIVSSISIPFLVAAEGDLQRWGAPIAALSVAILTALNMFFAWQKTWEKRVRVWLTIEGLIAIWEAEMTTAERQTDPKERFGTALQATLELIEATRKLEVEEAATLSAKFELPTRSTDSK